MKKYCLIFAVSIMFFLFVGGCSDQLVSPQNSIEFERFLSNYAIYEGDISNLEASSDYFQYELSSQLYSDAAEKQRLIKLPQGTKLEAINDDLLQFPNGTIIVKTFFYSLDKRDMDSDKRVIETRLLVKENDNWNVADYLWNDSQTEAELITSGHNTVVNYINEAGQPQAILYHVPNERECASCHLQAEKIVPIGPKVQNLNRLVTFSGLAINQLDYFVNNGYLENINSADFASIPDYSNPDLDVENRARAYMDINCAHCHQEQGLAADTELYLNYDLALAESQIVEQRRAIVKTLRSGEMPQLGTTTKDELYIDFLIGYINSLP